MERRQVLRFSGAALTLPLGGCASIRGRAAESRFTFTRTGELPVEKRTSEFARSYPGQEPFAEVVFGAEPKGTDDVHGVEIYNDCESPVEISLAVDDGGERTLVFGGEGTISTNEYMVIAISRPATYVSELEVRGDDVALQKTFDVPESAWEAGPADDKGISPEHNVHIQRNDIEVRFVGEER
ncbi:hypothetical protein ABNG02_09475 [Halorubrum ejinorense]|uniref:Lipoprotein n=1 Tax=Halorubrum ejinorense TaxID=425309 RepID=A0AAV3SP15_9EURY